MGGSFQPVAGCLAALVVLLLGSGFSEFADARPRIGLVLSGGGARGIAHIGVLKVLEELRIPIDAIAATSMGAVVGGAYAAGVSSGQMEAIVTTLDWGDLFTDAPAREFYSNRRKQDERRSLALSIGIGANGVLLPQGAISGQKLDLFLRQLAASAAATRDFDQLAIPFRAVATDLVTGKMVVFKDGDLETAMRASMSIPGVIAPAEVGDQLLVDGGLVRNLPVDIVRQMNVDVVVAVNLGTPLLKREALVSVLGVTAQMIAILTEQNVQASLTSLNKNDISILPELGDISAADFARAKEAIKIGVQAARKAAPRLKRLSLAEAEYQAWRTRFERLELTTTPERVDQIRIGQTKRVNPKTVESLLKTRPGEPLDARTLQEDLARVYGRGDFERLKYRFVEERGKRALLIEPFEKSWGPDYLGFGLALSSDLQNDAQFNFLARYTQTWLNDLGAEWQTDVQAGSEQVLRTEFYQPLSASGTWFVAPRFVYESRDVDIFSGKRRIAEYDVDSAYLGADLGLDLGSGGEWRFGVRRGLLKADPNIGVEELPSFDIQTGAFTVGYRYDQLDNLNFPKRGASLDLDLYLARSELGADDEYGKLQGNWLHAYSFGDHTLAAGLKFGSRIGNDIPVYDEFALGGFLNLSGYQTNQLRGQYAGLGRIVYYNNVAQLAGTFGGNIYAGGSLELGNVWGTATDIKPDNLKGAASAFIGADTPLGPLYLGYGIASDGESSFYLFLGRP